MRTFALLRAVMAAVFLVGALNGAEIVQKNSGMDEPHIEMRPEQVRKLLGAPMRISRQILLFRCIEQWDYPAPRPYQIVIETRRGQKSQILSVRKTQPTSP